MKAFNTTATVRGKNTEDNMSWLFNFNIRPYTRCVAELSPHNGEKSSNIFSKRILSTVDWLINSACSLVFIKLGKLGVLYNRMMRQSPDLCYAPNLRNTHCSRNPAVIKAILKQHRNDPQNGVLSHATVIKAIAIVMQKFYPKINSEDIIVTCGPENTKKFRDLLNQYFSSKSLQIHTPEIHKIIHDYVAHWQGEQQPIVLNQKIKHLSTAIMAQVFLGTQGNEHISTASSNTILWVADNLLSDVNPYIKWLLSYIVGDTRISPKVQQETIKTVCEAVNQALNNASDSSHRPSLVKTMLDQNFSQEQVQAMIITLFLAGQDNVSTSLTHALLKLAQLPDLQEAIRQDTASPMESRLIRALLCESLRTLCPVIGIARTVAKPAILTMKDPRSGEVTATASLNKGDELQSMLAAIAQDPSLYPNPEKFDYRRHLDQRSFLPELPHMPFGHGSHLCPGWNLYYVISAFTINALIKTNYITTTFQGEPKTENRFVNQITDTIPITLQPVG